MVVERSRHNHMNEASGIMPLLLTHGGTDLQANDPAYLNLLLQQVLKAQKVVSHTAPKQCDAHCLFHSRWSSGR